MSEWRLIETAPTDEDVLVFWVASEDNTAWLVPVGATGQAVGRRTEEGGWALARVDHPDEIVAVLPLPGAAIHWMPLPDPPPSNPSGLSAEEVLLGLEGRLPEPN